MKFTFQEPEGLFSAPGLQKVGDSHEKCSVCKKMYLFPCMFLTLSSVPDVRWDFFFPPPAFIFFRSFLEIDLLRGHRCIYTLVSIFFICPMRSFICGKAKKDACEDKAGSDWYLNPNLLNRNPLLRP